VSLASFGQVFAEGDYPGPALLGMMVATGVAVGVRRLGFGTVVSAIASVAGLTWYLSLVFTARFTFFSLPTFTSLDRLQALVVRAFEHSQVDYAPVPVRPGYAAMIVAGLWLSTTIGEVATFRWRRPLVASLLPTVLFAVSVVVGTGAGAVVYLVLFLSALLTYWGLESAHRLRSWGRWVSAWSHQKEVEPQSIAGALGRRLGASAIIAALISPLFLPAVGDGLLSWRSGQGEGVGPGGAGPGGGDGRVGLEEWVALEPGLVNQSEELLFEVQAAGVEYWRVNSLTRFNGREWEADLGIRPALDGQVDLDPMYDEADRLHQRVTIGRLGGTRLPAAVAPFSVGKVTEDGTLLTTGFNYGTETGAIHLVEGLDEGDTFEVASSVPSYSFKDLKDARPGEAPNDTYTEWERFLSPEVQALADSWTADANTDFERLVAIQNELRTFTYELNPPQTEQDDYLTDFLINTRAGYCQQFATAFALLARRYGFPTRVSVGFLPGLDDPTSDVFTVRGTDAHAWPEVLLDDHGWVRFEPTPRASGDSTAITPPYTIRAGLGGPVPIYGNGDSASNYLESNPGRGKRGEEEVGGNAAADAALDGRSRDRDAAARAELAAETSEWQKTFARLLSWLSIALALFLLAVPGLKELRTRRRYARAQEAGAIAEAAFIEFQENAAELATARRPSESALAFALRLSRLGSVADRSAVRLAAIYEAAAYSGGTISQAQADEARRLARRMRAQLWARASWWDRACRLFSPLRLWPSG